MADSDFANMELPGQSAAPKPSGSSSFFLVAGIMMVVGLAFSGGYWLGKEHGTQISDTAEKARLLAQINQQQAEMDRLRAEAKKHRRDAEAPTSRIGDLTFYNDLPKQSVTPAPLSGTGVAPPVEMASPAENDAAITPETPVQPAGGGNDLLRNIIQREMSGGALTHAYVVQVGSFRNRGDTAPLLKRLGDMGVNASVRAVDLKTKGQWFRVYAGPYASRDEASTAQRQIRDALKINGLVLRDS